ncbi:MAG: efflux transporter periplasmic adaptor subunit, partial [Bacteroidota bacterium]
ITVRAIISNQDRLLMPGAFVNIEIILKEYEETIQVPSIAVISELGGQKVFKYQKGKAIPVKVKTGVRTEQNVQITEGLNLGDTLITSGLVNVRPNAAIKLIEVK